MLYTSASASLALLETLAHFTPTYMAVKFCLATLEVNEKDLYKLPENKLPKNWDTFPAPEACKQIGNEFLQQNKYLGLIVPSAILPHDNNILINPLHPKFKQVSIQQKTILKLDKRLLKNG
jgi:RES domain-containing protein